jgi:predicted SAM-dependent methyltransferase
MSSAESKPLAARLGALLRRSSIAARVLDQRVALAQKRLDRRLAPRDAQLLASIRDRSDLKLNIGSWNEHLDGWLSLDIVRDRGGRVVRMDATRRWPFRDGSAIAVNSEHFIEHIDPLLAPAYFSEAFRVLAPGGVIRTSTPDLRGIVDAYLAADDAQLDAHRSHGYRAADHADLVNNQFYEHGHRHIYDFASLASLLTAAGFSDIEQARFNESRHPVLSGIDRHALGPLQGLVLAVDAVKHG